MYIKRILILIALLGLVGMGAFSYFVYTTLLKPNTSFSTKEASVYIKSDASYQNVLNQLEPLLKSIDKFDASARQKNTVPM